MSVGPHALILFAHGARDARWAEPFERLRDRVDGLLAENSVLGASATRVALAFLELMEPDLDRATDRLVADGCTALTIVPIFLGQGSHLRRDLPLLVEALRTAHPDLLVRLHPAIGEQASVIEAMARAAVSAAAFGE